MGSIRSIIAELVVRQFGWFMKPENPGAKEVTVVPSACTSIVVVVVKSLE